MLEAPTLTTAPLLRARLGDPNEVAELIATRGALLTGHFELLSGAHSDHFLRFSRIADDDIALDRVTCWLAPSVAAWMPTALVAPSTAGVALAWRLGQHLRLPVHLALVGADGRAASLPEVLSLEGERVALVNDVVTTGDGLAALAAVATGRGAAIAGAAWFVSRSDADVSVRVGAPVASVGELVLDAWSADHCRLCSSGFALNRAIELN